MDYALLTFDGHHFAHVAARAEHARLHRLTTLALLAIRGQARAGRPPRCFEPPIVCKWDRPTATALGWSRVPL